DLAITGYLSNDVSILISNGDGTFQLPRRYIVGDHPTSVVAADFDGNDLIDLIVGNDGINGAPVGIEELVGNGDGTFQAPRTIVTQLGFTLEVADLNGDGRPDLMTFKPGDTQAPYAFLNNGNGTFSNGVYYLGLPGPPSSLITQDFDGNGT